MNGPLSRLQKRLQRQWRARSYQRQARAAIARAERNLARRARVSRPGYDELRHPAFLAVMVGAVLALALDLSAGSGSSRVLGLVARAFAQIGGAS